MKIDISPDPLKLIFFFLTSDLFRILSYFLTNKSLYSDIYHSNISVSTK